MAAFSARQPIDEEQGVLDRIRIEGVAVDEIAVDHDAAGAPGDDRVERRRDAVASRVRWQFTDRLERVVTAQRVRE